MEGVGVVGVELVLFWICELIGELLGTISGETAAGRRLRKGPGAY